MTDLDNVIHALECCFDVQSGWKDGVWVCPACLYAKNDGQPCETLAPLLDDAIALLKAQQPRVMTLEEVRDDGEVIYLEKLCGSKTCYLGVYIIDHGESSSLFCSMTHHVEDRRDEYWSNYGKTWRCWTAKPDEKVRAETPWES